MTNYVEYYENPKHQYQIDEVNRIMDNLMNGTYTENGVLRWTSSNNVPPEDILELADHICLGFDMAATQEARKQDVSNALAAYIEAQNNRTPEQIAEEEAEMRAAFGPGETVVNVFTGKKVTL